MIVQRYYLVILLMAFFGFVFRAIVFYEELTLLYNTFVTLTTIVLIAILWFFFDWLNNYLNTCLPYEQALARRLIIQIGVGLLFAYIFINTIFYLNGYIYNWVRINKTVIVAGNLLWTLIVLAINGFFIGEYFFLKWKQALLNSTEAEKHLAQTKYANLQNQLNPHFLFNSLATLNSLIDENPTQATTFLKQLVFVYRYLMRHNQDVLVSIADELAFVEQYLLLLHTRFGNAFRYEITVGNTFKQHKIVPVTLQILIENAIKHNQMSEENPLFIEVYIDDEAICVKNPQHPKRNLATSNKIGLQNLKSLYALTAPKRMVEICDLTEVFIVKVPLL